MNFHDHIDYIDKILIEKSGRYTKLEIIEILKLIELEEITRILYNKFEAKQ